MEASSLLTPIPWKPKHVIRTILPHVPSCFKVSSNLEVWTALCLSSFSLVGTLTTELLWTRKGGYKGPKPKKEWISNWVLNNDETVRSLPIYVGGVSLVAVLFNRTISGIAPVADASRWIFFRFSQFSFLFPFFNIWKGSVWLLKKCWKLKWS